MLSKHTYFTTENLSTNPLLVQHRAWLGAMDKSEVPYVYHHLRKGCILQLHSVSGSDSRHLMYTVKYGSYFLGVLSSSLARRVQQLELEGKVYRLTISNIVKEKYLPPTAIEVELECESGFLTDAA
ncbi:MAG: hypothetical protein GC178_14740 [Flavobacteriales bacterium]|nr:hypothetical protein [Flavobacteriales bacterium]